MPVLLLNLPAADDLAGRAMASSPALRSQGLTRHNNSSSTPDGVTPDGVAKQLSTCFAVEACSEQKLCVRLLPSAHSTRGTCMETWPGEFAPFFRTAAELGVQEHSGGLLDRHWLSSLLTRILL